MNLLEAARRMRQSRELALFYRRWAAAESAGLPMREALQGIAAGAAPEIRRRARRLQLALERGVDLRVAAGPPFTETERSLLAWGLASGQLFEGLEALATLFETDWQVARRVQSRAVYPLLVALCGCWIPSLPLAFTVGAWAWLAVGIPASVAVFTFGGAWVFGHFTWLRGRPKLAQARFLRALSASMSAGIGFDEALALAIQVASPSALADRLAKVDPAGLAMSELLREVGGFSEAVVAMVESGEMSGALSTTLRRVADDLEDGTL